MYKNKKQKIAEYVWRTSNSLMTIRKLLDKEEEVGELIPRSHLCAWLSKKFLLHENINLYLLQILNKVDDSFKENSSEKGRIKGNWLQKIILHSCLGPCFTTFNVHTHHLRNFWKFRFVLGNLGWSLRFCISENLLHNASASGLCITN